MPLQVTLVTCCILTIRAPEVLLTAVNSKMASLATLSCRSFCSRRDTYIRFCGAERRGPVEQLSIWKFDRSIRALWMSRGAWSQCGASGCSSGQSHMYSTDTAPFASLCSLCRYYPSSCNKSILKWCKFQISTIVYNIFFTISRFSTCLSLYIIYWDTLKYYKSPVPIF